MVASARETSNDVGADLEDGDQLAFERDRDEAVLAQEAAELALPLRGGDRQAPHAAADRMSSPPVDALAEIGARIAENEATLSGLAAIIVVAGVVFTPIGSPPAPLLAARRVMIRRVT